MSETIILKTVQATEIVWMISLQDSVCPFSEKLFWNFLDLFLKIKSIVVTQSVTDLAATNKLNLQPDKTACSQVNDLWNSPLLQVLPKSIFYAN